MNKLFIIGNGFDLAHQYPTAYSDFVKWIWNNIHKNPHNEKFKKLIEINTNMIYLSDYSEEKEFTSIINCYDHFISRVRSVHDRYGNFHYGGLHCKMSFKEIYSFKNKFFYKLCITYPDAKWSDIENLFYKTLIEVLENKSKEEIDIESLNADMEYIKELFSDYLCENINYGKIKKNSQFEQLLKYRPKHLSNSHSSIVAQNYLDEFPSETHNYLKNNDLIIKKAYNQEFWDKDEDVPNTLILDFNYTETISNYLNNIEIKNYIFGKIQHIKIHGELLSNENPINLGFGDEMDDHYKTLEKKNDNKFLKYIKSFMYSNNTNYRKLLNWIDTNDFQVFILGHSCGLSDRIMLNTIFEKDRCKSIKVYFYQWKKNEIKQDDFTDKIQNISRHFNKKALMREKLVDKSLSMPLEI